MLWVYVFGNVQVTFDMINMVAFCGGIALLGFLSEWPAYPTAYGIAEHVCNVIGFGLASLNIKRHLAYHRRYGEHLMTMEFVVPLFVVGLIAYRYYLLHVSTPDPAGGAVTASDIAPWKIYLSLSLLTQADGWFSKIFTGFSLGGFVQSILFNGF
jgi:hypothetical protein